MLCGFGTSPRARRDVVVSTLVNRDFAKTQERETAEPGLPLQALRSFANLTILI